MATNLLSTSRLADYFFVCGLHDNHLLATYDAVKRGQITSADEYYYDQQRQAVAVTSNEAPEPVNNRTTGKLLPQSSSKDSLAEVLDHVQSIIDIFDKERDSARDNVIAVHEPLNGKTNRKRSVTAAMPRLDSEPTVRRKLSIKPSKAWSSVPDYRAAYSEPPSEDLGRILESSEETLQQALFNSDRSMQPNLLDIKYIPTVLLRYPRTDHSKSEAFPSYIAMFCFPRDISLRYGTHAPVEQLHSFAMTDENGDTIYGTCIVFYEKLAHRLRDSVNKALQQWIHAHMDQSTVEYARHLQERIQTEQAQVDHYGAELVSLNTMTSTPDITERKRDLEEQLRTCQENVTLYTELLEPVKMAVCTSDCIWVPKAIGLVSRMPWHDLFGDWLRIMLDSIVGVQGRKAKGDHLNIQSAVYNIIREVPLPPPGRFEISLSISQRSLFFSRPSINEVPILKNFSLFPLFRALSSHLILAVLETLLSEGKVLFLSNHPGMLSVACESFRYLLFPFYWQFVFIPVLPEKLLACLQVPVPFLIGFQGQIEDLADNAPDDVCIVNLDSNTMHQYHPGMRLPDRQRRKLQLSLEQYAPLHTRSKVPYGVPLTIKEAFPKGRMMLNCHRSKAQELSTSLPRKSESSANHSIWSNPASVLSRPLSGFWSANESIRSSNDSDISFAPDIPTPVMPQHPSNAKLASTTSVSSNTHASSSSSFAAARSNQQLPRSDHWSFSLHPKTTPSSGSPFKTQPSSYRHSAGNADELNRARSQEMTVSSKDSRRSSQTNSIRKLSGLMSRPQMAFQPGETVRAPDFGAVNSVPPITHSGTGNNSQTPTTMQKMWYIEGHPMVEVAPQDLWQLQGYRCLCGQSVQQNDQNQRHLTFVCCQECHLVTHDTCMNQILHPCLPSCFDEENIQHAFLRMFASLLCHYRAGFVSTSAERNGMAFDMQDGNPKKRSPLVFSKEKFLKQSDKDIRTYLAHLTSSQMFTQFIMDRLSKSDQDPEVLIFDEFIKLKLNRSKLKFVKEDTPFLKDASYRASQIIWANSPDPVPGPKYDRFPIDLDFSNTGSHN
ncbi:AEX-3 domain-containing protein [Radiomyces spectabilis]|uniref:AEX-3 domain-containing protein n=1 Tax=Radiomyces spectabilis TaxID=64574 RepID=UPI00221FE0F3|nr:AEX-3 domain-containing protein [Radiomyces spectabilis]KAI8377993.1 AEX-3 domain-containing protein [Radiomyces spectabilis]